MTDFPKSLPEFERRFPDEAACAEWLLEHRWARGFACPACGHDACWRLGRKVLTLQCRACRRETSVTAGTVMHRSHLLLRKLRAAMVDPGREPLAGLVEVDESSLPSRARDEPVRPGRSHEGKLLIAGAVEIVGKGPGRVRPAAIDGYSAAALGGFVAAAIAPGGTVVSDGWSGYKGLEDVRHDPKVVGDTPAHQVLPWIHRVFANAKRWMLGVYHGLRAEHLQAYLDEFVFRFNRRRHPQAAFARLLGLATTIGPHPYTILIASGSKG
jgi:transposase-like protein